MARPAHTTHRGLAATKVTIETVSKTRQFGHHVHALLASLALNSPQAQALSKWRTFALLSKCRGTLVRYDKKDANFHALIQMDCGLYLFARLRRLEVLT